MDTRLGALAFLLVHLFYLSEARSSGRLIIDTAKKALEEAQHRQRRSVDGNLPTLESLLLHNAPNQHLVDFDLILEEDQFRELSEVGQRATRRHRQKRKAVRHQIYHWPGAEVAYRIEASVDAISSSAKFRVKKAMSHWERHTCVKFVEYDPLKHTNYVTIQKGQWCASKLGMVGGVQPLYVALGCLDTGTIIHELGHTLGWVHEQARPDRDDYVSIKWELVSASYKSQYVKHGTDFINTYGVPYDYGSIMHYPSYGELITKDASQQHVIGQRNRLSFNDIKLANAMYQCAERSKCDKTRFQCTDGGFMDHTCKCVCPDGDMKSCTVSNGGFKPFTKVQTTPSPTVAECDPWTVYDNSYIPGNNDDVGFAHSVEQCKARCVRERKFNCQSFDYWKQRRQCYLSGSTASSLRIQYSHDARMAHYQLSNCPTTTVVSTSNGKNERSTTKYTLPPYLRSTLKPVAASCPFEYTSVGLQCIRPLGFPARPVHIAKQECQNKLQAKLWDFRDGSLDDNNLYAAINDKEEYWVNIDNYNSSSSIAKFFDFCPYVTKEAGKLYLKDTFCFKQKGFLCEQL